MLLCRLYIYIYQALIDLPNRSLLKLIYLQFHPFILILYNYLIDII